MVPRRQAVIAEPRIVTVKIPYRAGHEIQYERFLVIASDGVWDVMTNHGVAVFVAREIRLQRRGEYSHLVCLGPSDRDLLLTTTDYRNRGYHIEARVKFLAELDSVRTPMKSPRDLKLDLIAAKLVDTCIIHHKSEDNCSAMIILMKSDWDE